MSDDVSNLPSWMRKKGTVEPKKDSPEQKQQSNRESVMEFRPSSYVQPKKETELRDYSGFQEKREEEGLSLIWKTLIIVSLVIGIFGIYLAYSSYDYVNKFKSRVREVSEKLRSLEEGDLFFDFEGTHRGYVKQSVPLNQAITQSFGIPIELRIPIKKQLIGRMTGGTVQIDVNDEIYVKDVIVVQPYMLSNKANITLATNISGPVLVTGRIKVKDILGKSIENISAALEELGK